MKPFRIPSAPAPAARRFALGAAPDKRLVRPVAAAAPPDQPALQYRPPEWSAAPSGRVRVCPLRGGVELPPLQEGRYGWSDVL